MTQQVKYLLCNPEGLNSILGTHIKVEAKTALHKNILLSAKLPHTPLILIYCI